MKPAVGGELAGRQRGAAAVPGAGRHMWVVKFLRTHGLIHDCPKLVQLRTFPTIAIGGDLAGAAGLLTAMICHLAVFHPPDLLQIRVLTENPDDPDVVLAEMASARCASDRNRRRRAGPDDLHPPG